MIFVRDYLRKMFLAGGLAISLTTAALDLSYGSLSPSSRRDLLAEYTDLQFPGILSTVLDFFIKIFASHFGIVCQTSESIAQRIRHQKIRPPASPPRSECVET